MLPSVRERVLQIGAGGEKFDGWAWPANKAEAQENDYGAIGGSLANS